MKCTFNTLFHLLLLPFIIVCSTGQEADGNLDLESMSNEELEDICVKRGFELVKDKDEATGELKTYSHEDYVNAAKQCLQIESEMEEVLTKHPELLKDIEAEAEKMKKEKARLEKEIQELQKKDYMSGKTSEKEEKSQTGVKAENMEGEEEERSKENDEEEQGNNQGKVESEPEPEPQDEDNEIIDLDEIDDAAKNTNEEKGESNDENPKEEKNTFKSENTSTTSPVAKNDDISLDLWEELKAQVRKDLNRVADLFLPKPLRRPLMKALKPALKVAEGSVKTIVDMVKRYTPTRKQDQKTAQDESKKSEDSTS